MKKIIKNRNHPPRICLLIDLARSACRDKLEGILRYDRLYGPMQIHMPDLNFQPLKSISFRDYDGIIADGVDFFFPPQHLLQTHLPMVFIDKIWTPTDDTPFGMVLGDNEAIGKMGAEFFLNHRLEHFAYVEETAQTVWSQNRGRGFAACLESKGINCTIYQYESAKNKQPNDLRRLSAWLQKLPRPVGVLCASDLRAHYTLEACRTAGLDVPGDVLLLGVDNDLTIDRLCDPPLSSIMNNNVEGGFLSARLMNQLLKSAPTSPQTLYYQPSGVCERKSTLMYQNAPPFVQEAYEFIGLNAGIGIRVSDVQAHVRVSRRTLEQHFHKTFQRTVLDEINRVRFQRVRDLLLETNLSVREIARMCGFQSDFYIYTAYKHHFGVTIQQQRGF